MAACMVPSATCSQCLTGTQPAVLIVTQLCMQSKIMRACRCMSRRPRWRRCRASGNSTLRTLPAGMLHSSLTGRLSCYIRAAVVPALVNPSK